MVSSTTRLKQVLLLYVGALVAPVLALLLRVAMERLSVEFPSQLPFGELPRYLFFIPVVLIAAIFVDAWAGLLATMTCTLLICYWVLPPKGQFKVGQTADIWGLILFWIVGAAVCVIAELYHRNRRKLEDYGNELAAQEAQRESEQQFQTLANRIPQLCWMTDANGWIFWYNQRWFDYTGTTLEEMQG
jgi:PAS domain-containing protein